MGRGEFGTVSRAPLRSEAQGCFFQVHEEGGFSIRTDCRSIVTRYLWIHPSIEAMYFMNTSRIMV